MILLSAIFNGCNNFCWSFLLQAHCWQVLVMNSRRSTRESYDKFMCESGWPSQASVTSQKSSFARSLRQHPYIHREELSWKESAFIWGWRCFLKKVIYIKGASNKSFHDWLSDVEFKDLKFCFITSGLTPWAHDASG